jgi:hypothetical protein
MMMTLSFSTRRTYHRWRPLHRAAARPTSQIAYAAGKPAQVGDVSQVSAKVSAKVSDKTWRLARGRWKPGRRVLAFLQMRRVSEICRRWWRCSYPF